MNLSALAQTMLSAFTVELKTLGVDVPDVRYVSPGLIPAYDGEQLTINLQAISQGQPGQTFTGTYVAGAENLQAQYSVSLVRVIPALSNDGSVEMMLPAAEELDESAVSLMGDAQGLMQAAIAIHAAHSITEVGMGFAIDGVMTEGPDGGVAACRLIFTISIN